MEYGQRLAARAIATKTHVGDVDFVLAQQGPEMADDAGAVRVIEHQQDAVGLDFDGLAEEPHDARIVWRAEKSAASADDLVIAVKELDVQPLVEGYGFVAPLFFHG